jgi:hypothetical protein
MLDLYGELHSLLDRFDEEGIEYALCGGMALAVYGVVRATIDIDLLVLTVDRERALAAARDAGFDVPAAPMEFAAGKVQIARVTKFDPEAGDHLSLDLLNVTPALERVWSERQALQWGGRQLKVVSREGLIVLKGLRSSPQDVEDIRKLKEAK